MLEVCLFIPSATVKTAAAFPQQKLLSAVCHHNPRDTQPKGPCLLRGENKKIMTSSLIYPAPIRYLVLGKPVINIGLHRDKI